MRRRLLAVVVVVLTVTAVAMPAWAAPAGEPFEITCDGAGTIEIVTPGRGGWTPGLATDGTAVFIPYKQKWTLYYDPDGPEGEFVIPGGSGEAAKNTPPQNLIDSKGDRCTFEFTVQAATQEEADLIGLPGPGVGRLEGTAWGLRAR